MLVCILYYKRGLKSVLNEVFVNVNKKLMFRYGYYFDEGIIMEIFYLC